MKSLVLYWFFLSCLTCFAADTYSVSNNTLSVPLDNFNNIYYTDVKLKVGRVLNVGTQTNTSIDYDTHNTQNNQLTIPEVVVDTATYFKVVITVGAVVSVGGVCASLELCLTNSASTLYVAAAPNANAIQASYSPGALKAANSLTALGQVRIKVETP